MRLYRRSCHTIKRKPKLLWHRKRDPFIEIDSVFNLRGFGGYKSTLFPGTVTREGLIYRSGHLGDVTAAGWHSLQQMKISTVIDLTSPGEVEIFTGAPDRNFRPLGVETMHMPFKQGVFSMERQVEKYQAYRNIGHEVVARGYLNLLEVGSSIIQRILMHFRDTTEGACLIHCAMGKDRTGVIFALLLSIAGVSHKTIADEFSLSEAHLQHLQPRIADIVRTIDPSEHDATEIARLALECRTNVMALTLQMIEKKYGGVVQYARDICGLSMKDINRLQQNLLSS